MKRGFVVKGAAVFDGTGAEPSIVDVGVVGDRIVAVGACDDRSLLAIDGAGLFLAPGFIDCHCHDDLAMLREPDRIEKIAQGVTTVIVGNCGFSLFPCNDSFRESLVEHAGSLLGSLGPTEVFECFDDYRRNLGEHGIGINVASLVGHGPLRLEALGFDSSEARSQEVESMEKRLEAQLQQGAIGLSLGLVYPPSAYATRLELLALCRVAARCGKPVAAHIRSYEAALLDATHEFLDLLRESGARGILSHLQAAGRPNWGMVTRALLELELARMDGIDVCFDMYPYLAGSSYALQLLPPSALEGGIGALKERLDSATYRAVLRAKVEQTDVDADGWQSKISVIGWESVLIAGTSSQALRDLEGKTLLEASLEASCEPFDVLERLIRIDNGATTLVLFQLAEDDLRAAFTHGLHMVGSDGIPRCGGSPHPRAFGAFPRVLNKIVGDARWISLPDAIRRMTSEPAMRFGLLDRGRIRPEAFADMVLFEPGFSDQATYEHSTQLATGAQYVWVNGKAVWAEGRSTGVRAGRVLA